MPRRLASASVDAIVQHAANELRLGAPLEHVLREAAFLGALYGSGLTQQQAVRSFELQEPSLLGMGRYEAREAQAMGFHPGIQARLPGMQYGVPGQMTHQPVSMIVY